MGNESGRSGAVSLDEWRDPDAVDYQCCDEHSEIGCEGGHHQNERERHIAHRAKLGLRKKPVKSTSLNFACFVLRGVGKGDRPSGCRAFLRGKKVLLGDLAGRIFQVSGGTHIGICWFSPEIEDFPVAAAIWPDWQRPC